ncbi:MAG: hypothetical protein OES57_14610, partial [Acidimicrobiia bacterium]|nr:hypothetical protein [Acidimicrobiia bacterium]
MTAAAPSPTNSIRARAEGSFTVDPWGLDPDWHAAALKLAGARWRVRVAGERRIPARGPVMVVVNRGIGFTEPLVAALGIASVSGRPARMVGLPDVSVVGSFLRRIGAVLAHPDEVSSLLRAGELVVAPLQWRLMYGGMAGGLDLGLATAAVETGATVLPSVARGHEWGRTWHYTIGTSLHVPATSGREPAV